jgi:hypothetical protein
VRKIDFVTDLQEPVMTGLKSGMRNY